MARDPYMDAVARELERTVQAVDGDATNRLAELVGTADRIFAAGAGRSGLMMRAFAMRLMHLGLQSFVVGESVTPALTSRDLLIIGSGSGETKSLAAMAVKAKQIGAAVAVVTVSPSSSIGRMADAAIQVHASPKEASANPLSTVQPMGSLFEQSLLLVLDAVVLRLMDRGGIAAEAMFVNHANLE